MLKVLGFPVLDTGSYEYFSFQKSTNTWPYEVTAFNDLPDSYKKVFPSFKESFPYTIIIPDEDYSFFRKKGFLITVIGDKPHIFNKLGSEINSICFDAEDIMYIDSGNILLNSWITIAGEKRVYTFNFSCQMEHLFLPLIIKFRKLSQSKNTSTINNDMHLISESIDAQLQDNIKFKNLLYNPCIELNKMRDILFQPRYLLSYIKLPCLDYKLFKRYISNHLILLTEEELIFIQESNIVSKNEKNNCDNIFTFIHKKNITSFEKKYEQRYDQYNLIFTLKNGTKLSSCFSKKNTYFIPFISKLSKSIEMNIV